MDPKKNPFSPGAGFAPPELAGREEIVDDVAIDLARVMAGRPAQPYLLVGLRGVGKTVLLNKVNELATEQGFRIVFVESPEDRSLAEILVPPLRRELFRLSKLEKARDLARRALGILRGFASAFKVSSGDLDFGVEAAHGEADSGELEADLPEVLISVAQAAKQAGSAVVLLIDEVQYLGRSDFAALLVALHKVAQRNLPLTMIGAGLPQVRALAGEAKSYAERLFVFKDVGPLSPDSAREAVVAPVEREGVAIDEDAAAEIVLKTQGYPYFLQAWGQETWKAAPLSPIRKIDVQRATDSVLSTLDEGFFRVRLDRLTPREKDYVRAMAVLGAGTHRSGEIAQRMNLDVTTAAPLREGLIRKGMIYSPRHGDTDFTVPMFDEFIRREFPDWSPPGPSKGKGKRRPRY